MLKNYANDFLENIIIIIHFIASSGTHTINVVTHIQIVNKIHWLRGRSQEAVQLHGRWNTWDEILHKKVRGLCRL